MNQPRLRVVNNSSLDLELTSHACVNLVHSSMACSIFYCRPPMFQNKISTCTTSLNLSDMRSLATGLDVGRCHALQTSQVLQTALAICCTSSPTPARDNSLHILSPEACHQRTCNRRKVRRFTSSEPLRNAASALPMSKVDQAGLSQSSVAWVSASSVADFGFFCCGGLSSLEDPTGRDSRGPGG